MDSNNPKILAPIASQRRRDSQDCEFDMDHVGHSPVCFAAVVKVNLTLVCQEGVCHRASCFSNIPDTGEFNINVVEVQGEGTASILFYIRPNR